MCEPLRTAWDIKTVWPEAHMGLKGLSSNKAGSEQGKRQRAQVKMLVTSTKGQKILSLRTGAQDSGYTYLEGWGFYN